MRTRAGIVDSYRYRRVTKVGKPVQKNREMESVVEWRRNKRYTNWPDLQLILFELSVNDCWVVSLRGCCSGKTLTSALAMDWFEISPVYMYGSKDLLGSRCLVFEDVVLNFLCSLSNFVVLFQLYQKEKMNFALAVALLLLVSCTFTIAEGMSDILRLTLSL